jgi:hypothetical protein
LSEFRKEKTMKYVAIGVVTINLEALWRQYLGEEGADEPL